MYVIFPADELILMTYGAAIPRHKPRPTLDCLREPQVPIGFCSNTITPVTATITTTDDNTNYDKTNIALAIPAETTESITANCVQTNITAYDNLHPLSSFEKAQNITQSLPPTPTRITARTHLTRSTPNSFKRDSLQSIRAPQATPAAQPHQLSLQGNNKTNSVPNKLPMYNDTNMSNTPGEQQQQTQTRTGTRRPTLTRSSAIRSATPVRANTPQRSFDTYYANDNRSDMGATYSGAPSVDYPTGLLNTARERSPSIFLEPPSPDPTQLTIGPGWGRPMSPMDLPPPPKSPPNSSKSRLRPKLHIPLGRLGRSTSTEQRESQRLKEDLQLHVENPIFNSENLRQRNFDAFFESGEPVYKLQPKAPNSAPSETASISTNYSPILGNHSSASSSGGLFARTPREEKALAARSKSAEVYETPREARAASVGGGVPQKGDSLAALQEAKEKNKFCITKSKTNLTIRKIIEVLGLTMPRYVTV
ncbi:mucin-2-like [Teleopsis dalmanni]|uniref:mucin-2-like n=1 Tax=Teleopsis dalmanni TaxID=139649 RepID=UPI0018CF1C4D|nr:mucin-2-like [Teleopsis dalmanni]XP_037944222.1 mucin-2-like [Teleopsis dalmanni]